MQQLIPSLINLIKHFQRVINTKGLAYPLLESTCMKMTLTLRHLGDISSDISQGLPLWGLLRANEYLASDSRLRKALVSKTTILLNKNPKYEHLIGVCKQIYQGTKFGELDQQVQQAIIALEEGRTRNARKTMAFSRKISHSIRKQRLNNLLKAA